MTRVNRHLLFSIAISALLALTFPIPAFLQSPDTDPALWVVRGQGATVYLFGRMAVPTETDWITPKVEEAFDASDILWLENPSSDSEPVDELIAELGFREGYSVLNLLDESDRMRLVAILERGGASPELLEGRKAWLSYLFVSNVIDRLNGIATSPDGYFRDQAEATEKEIRSEWPTMREFVQFAAALPDTTHLQMIRKALDGSGSYEELLEAWLRGDLEALTQWSGDFATKYPDAYRQLNSERNAKWVAFIQDMLTRGGTHFISVGIGHLNGPDSIVSRLESTGFAVERL